MAVLGLAHRAQRLCAKTAAAIGIAGLTIGASSAAAADQAPEYAVKAAYLSKLGLFVEWPKTSFPSPTSAVVVCVAGDNPFGDALDKVVEGQHINTHPVTVRYLKTVTRESGCDVLYVAGSGPQSAADAFDAVGAGVLTVADAARDDQAAGIVDFVVQDNRVRFNINQQAASRNGITISSHLLSIALSVKSKN